MDLAILVSTDIQVLTDTIKMLSNSPISTAQCELIFMSRLHENDIRTRCLVADDPPVDDTCSLILQLARPRVTLDLSTMAMQPGAGIGYFDNWHT
jgi:hypothetical protein